MCGEWGEALSAESWPQVREIANVAVAREHMTLSPHELACRTALVRQTFAEWAG
jgi:hypothetical protein